MDRIDPKDLLGLLHRLDQKIDNSNDWWLPGTVRGAHLRGQRPFSSLVPDVRHMAPRSVGSGLAFASC
jgi:hypothetical protein